MVFGFLCAWALMGVGALCGLDAVLSESKTETIFQQQIIYMRYIVSAVLVGAGSVTHAVVLLHVCFWKEQERRDKLLAEAKKAEAA